MAAAVMKAWHINPVVSAVTLSASSGTITQSLRTQVTGVSASANHLEWDQMDQSLPLPLNFDNALMNFVVNISDLASYDQEILAVKELQPGDYKLIIDKSDVGTFSAQQLADGINLALFKTPMWHQARDYDGALERHSALENADFYLFAETDISDKAAASQILREGEAAFEQKAQKALRIASHHYEIFLMEPNAKPRQ